jgi:curved DNA-binding protein CbpA
VLFLTDKTRNADSAKIFTSINEAWSVLSDPERRAELDRTVSIKKFGPISETVLLADLDATEQPSVYTRNCRCGDVYEVSSSIDRVNM